MCYALQSHDKNELRLNLKLPRLLEDYKPQKKKYTVLVIALSFVECLLYIQPCAKISAYLLIITIFLRYENDMGMFLICHTDEKVKAQES
jgi:hypothetical protein